MLRRFASTALLTGSLMCGLLSTATTPSTLHANAIGVIATVAAIDARGIATLKTDEGETFTIAKASLWTVGTRVLCERVADTTPHYVQHCQLR